jgi:cation transport protein ChaC
MNRKSPVHVEKLKVKEVADVLVSACGHWGWGAEYL